MAKKNTDREDFWGANHLRMDNGRKCAAFTSSFDRNKSDGKASLKR